MCIYIYIYTHICVLHGESNKGPASPRTIKPMAQSKPPTNQPSHTQTTRQPTNNTTCAFNIRRTTHSSQHFTAITTNVTAHQRSIPQATHAHPRPRQSAHNNTATILHTPVPSPQPSHPSLYAAQAVLRDVPASQTHVSLCMHAEDLRAPHC